MANLKTTTVNAWESRLSSALAAGATTINVTDTTGVPPIPFYVTVDPGNDTKRERILVDSAVTATTLTLSAATSRGRDGSSDVAHDSGAVIAIVPIAALWNDLQDRVDTKANDADVVKLAGAQTITGAKTFSVDPTLADGSSALSLTEGNAAYLPTSLWVPAAAIGLAGGAATLSNVAGGRASAWLLDSASTENLGVVFSVPSHWTTFNVECHYVNAGAGSGDVVFRTLARGAADGETLAADDAGGNVTDTALAQDVLRAVTLLSGVTRRAGFTNIRVGRLGADAADTLGNDIGLLGVSLVKAS